MNYSSLNISSVQCPHGKRIATMRFFQFPTLILSSPIPKFVMLTACLFDQRIIKYNNYIRVATTYRVIRKPSQTDSSRLLANLLGVIKLKCSTVPIFLCNAHQIMLLLNTRDYSRSVELLPLNPILI